jgi:hypothetical protein
MILKYQSGDEIKNGDRVLYHGDSAEIQFVVTDDSDPETKWYFTEFGGGIMISPVMVFISASDINDDEDLEFVSRADSSPHELK